MPEGEPGSKSGRVNTLIGAVTWTALQTALFSEQRGNGSVSCPWNYYVCQLRAKPGSLSEQDQACSGCVHTLWFALVQLSCQYLDVWLEFVRMVFRLPRLPF